MLLTRFRRVILFCPAMETGGPEAIHQFADALNRIGVEAIVAYTGGDYRVAIEPPRIGFAGPRTPLAGYAGYDVRLPDDVTVTPDTLLVAPEAWAVELADTFRPLTVAVWWLSLDGAFFRQPQLNEEAFRRDFLSRPNLVHLAQSTYAKAWLVRNGAERVFDLSDYTNPVFTAEPADRPSPKPLISYNPEKGGTAAEPFFAQHAQFEALPLRGYSKPQLRDIFRERLLYIDFGGFPGKDRIPREAAACGGIVFLHRRGSAAVFEDFPLPGFFKFTLDDVTSGELAGRLAACVCEPERHWEMQAEFRSRIWWEKPLFQATVARLWGRRPSRDFGLLNG